MPPHKQQQEQQPDKSPLLAPLLLLFVQTLQATRAGIFYYRKTMTREEQEKANAVAIVVDVLQLLQNKNLTVCGAVRILDAAIRSIGESVPYVMPENNEWLRRHAVPVLPVFVKKTEPEELCQHEQVSDPKLQETLMRSISHLKLPERALNCFRENNIRTIGDLVHHTENDLLELRSFGETSLRQVKESLVPFGIGLREENH